MISLQDLEGIIDWEQQPQASGSLYAVRSGLAYARIPLVALGDLCYIERRSRPPLPAQVVSFSEDICCLAPFDNLIGVAPGATIRATGRLPCAHIAGDPRGKVLDALGLPLHDQNSNDSTPVLDFALDNPPPPPLQRSAITEQLFTGIRSLDALHGIGYGQRLGLFASAGVGKSTLLGMIARNARVDVAVIALVGERGREVNEFIEHSLGQDGMAKSVVVVATSDESPIRRMLAPKTATSIAEWYRDQGLNVLLLVDSLTRTARAIREVELAAGALPVRQGYTSGVYSELPKLLERSGNAAQGSITALYTVLTAGAEEFDPLADEIKSILDGHLILDPSLVHEGIRPAIDPLSSVSRVADKLYSAEHRSARQQILSALSRIRRDKDIVLMGGSASPDLRAALTLEPDLKGFLNQSPEERQELSETLGALRRLSARLLALQREEMSKK